MEFELGQHVVKKIQDRNRLEEMGRRRQTVGMAEESVPTREHASPEPGMEPKTLGISSVLCCKQISV